MLAFVKQFYNGGIESPELTSEERNLLLIAYKNVLSPKQRAWRIVTSLEKEEEEVQNQPNANPEELQMIREHRKLIEQEIEALCNEVLKVVDEILLPNSHSAINKVFFHKMKADYLRYLLEIQSGDVRKDVTTAKALESYSTASSVASTDLKASDPVRLGVALNFSVFYHEILHSYELACDIAKKAFDAALIDLNSTADDWNKETTTIMHLIKENLTLWMSTDIDPNEYDQGEGEDDGEVVM